MSPSSNAHNNKYCKNKPASSPKYWRNEIEIIGKNQIGSDRDNVIIFYEKRVDLPIVNITSPDRSPFKTDLRNVSVQANLVNVTSKSDVRLSC